MMPAMETLGEMAPEYSSVGGEGMYNAGRPVAQVADPLESVYNKMRGTMGPAKPPIPGPPPPPSPFQQMQRAGEFAGDRSVRGIGNLQQEAPGGLNDLGALSALRRMR
jgi:hypothetical protein